MKIVDKRGNQIVIRKGAIFDAKELQEPLIKTESGKYIDHVIMPRNK